MVGGVPMLPPKYAIIDDGADGRFITSCLPCLMRTPAIAEVIEWAGWRKDGCLDPHKLCVPLRRAVWAFLQGYAAGEARRWDESKPGK